MSRASILPVLPGSRLTVLREDFLRICDGNIAAALILNQMEYWTGVRVGSAIQSGKRWEDIKLGDLWFYESVSRFHASLMGLVKEYEVRAGLAYLKKEGLMETRTMAQTGGSKWDRRLQYRLNIRAISNRIRALTHQPSKIDPPTVEGAPDDAGSVAGESSLYHVSSYVSFDVEGENGAAPPEGEEVVVVADSGQVWPGAVAPSATPHISPSLQSPSSIAPNGGKQNGHRTPKGDCAAIYAEADMTDPVDELMDEVDRICATDRQSLFGRPYRQWCDGFLGIKAQGATPKGLRSWSKWYLRQGKWQEVDYQQDWRGKKEQRPTPAIISETYTAFKRDVERIKGQVGRAG